MNADGSNQTLLTTNSTQFGISSLEPAWSPVGGRIAFRSNIDGDYEIYVINEDGSNQTRLTNNGRDDLGPAWSQDGSKIAFASNRDSNFEIYVMNANGNSPTRLSNNSGLRLLPRLVPGGQPLGRLGPGPYLILPIQRLNSFD